MPATANCSSVNQARVKIENMNFFVMTKTVFSILKQFSFRCHTYNSSESCTVEPLLFHVCPHYGTKLIAIVALNCAIVHNSKVWPPMGPTQANSELTIVSNHQPRRRPDREVQANARNGRARPKPGRARSAKPKRREIMT
ncbi:hypothetical protein B9Z55_029061 [Caenorhabditis nigoni]|uniref:Uncharacterized protein n=1 Tax=Caenorhabditis nigoni TaxID=1611254 RepID=A0A2G5S8U3_9PELO|nr:hypothetical protein B9Z55_029061 [Caenorhabditis nigoni]